MDLAAMVTLLQQQRREPSRIEEASGLFQTTCGRYAAWRLEEPVNFSADDGLDMRVELFATEAEATSSLSADVGATHPMLGYISGHVLNREAIRADFPVVMDEISDEAASMAHDLFTTTGELLPSIRNNKKWIDWGTAFATFFSHDRLLIVDTAELQPDLRGQGLAASLWRDICCHLAQREAPIFRAAVCSIGFDRPELTPKETDCVKSGTVDYEAVVAKTLRPCGFRCFKEDYFGCAAGDFGHPSWKTDAQDIVVDREPKRPREDEDEEDGAHPALRRFADAEGGVWRPALEGSPLPPLPTLPEESGHLDATDGSEEDEEGDGDDENDDRVRLGRLPPLGNSDERPERRLPSLPSPPSPPEIGSLPERRGPALSAAAHGHIVRDIVAFERECTCGQCTASVSRNTMDALASVALINADVIRQDPKDVTSFAARPSVTVEDALRQGQVFNRNLEHFLDCGGRIGAIIASVVQQCENENTATPLFGVATVVTPALDECDRDYDWATLLRSLLGPGAAHYLDTLNDMGNEDDFQDEESGGDDLGPAVPDVAFGSG